MSRMQDSLGAVEQSLARLRRPVIELLKPGLPSNDIRQAIEQLGLVAPSDLGEIYEWRNGTDLSTGAKLDDLYLIPGFYFLSLGDALTDYDSFIRSPRWQNSWLPLLADGGGDFLVVDCSFSSGAHGAVFHFRIDQADHPLEYRSILEMITTFQAAYERGVFHVDDQGFLEMDDDLYASLAESLNPGVEWWAN